MKQRHVHILLLTLVLTFVAQLLHAQRFYNLTSDQVKIDSVLPHFTYTIPLSENYNDSIYTVEILYPEFIDMSSTDIQRYNALSGSILPNLPAIQQQVVFDRKKPSLQISFTPLAMRQNTRKILVSFMLSVKSTAKKRTQKATLTRVATLPADRYAANSKLSTGKWAKIRVKNTGVYQLTNDVIKRAGFTDINKVKIYGYGGWLQNEQLRPQELEQLDDLKEVPTCNINGKRLFFAKGTVSWSSASTSKRTRNPYSDYGYYFITQTDEEPLKMDSTAFLASFYPTFNDYHSIYEVDNYAWFEGGRNLFDAEVLNNGASKTYTLNAPKGVSTAKMLVNITSNNTCEVQVSCNGKVYGNIPLSWNNSSNGSDAFSKAKEVAFGYTIDNISEQNNITLQVTKGNNVRLDYITLTFNTPFAAPHLKTDNFPSAEYVYNITNQNLHADDFYDMVIIIPTTQKLLAQAKRLKAFHEEFDKMKVRIVPADELYNEFSSGTPDANAYRRYMKMLYDRAGNDEQKMPKYLVLFGDGSFDNRMNTAEWRGKNPDDYLLCYESENSFHKVYCYVDDGFYCLLDDNEGGNLLSADKPDIAVGRIPVVNDAQAKVVVDKIVAYNTNHNAGDWQNTIFFMGDDGNENLHMQDVEDAATMIEGLNPAYHIKKVMWDAFNRVNSAQGATYPDVSKIIKQQQAQGALIMDYVGHGVEYQISHENVLRLSDFTSFNNKNLPLWITASCDIMPFDGTVANIGESALLNPNGGAVAFFGTTRTVYANYNKRINMSFLKHVLSNDAKGKPISVGEAQRLAKNDMIDSGADHTENKLQYALLGDPALVLRRPTLNISIDEINGTPCVAGSNIVIKAGEVTTVKGHIVNHNTFKGKATILVRDGEETIVGKQNNKEETTTPFTYKDRTKVLFNGTDSIKDGKFTFSFAIPKDISHSNNSGLINVYAVNEDKTVSANGYNKDFTIQGGNISQTDSVGPSIFCYLNSPSFTNGGKVNSTPLLVIELLDKSGINVSGNGIGHDLQVTIDGDMNKTYNLNSNFKFDFGSYTKGTALFNIPELEPGNHQLRIRAWDIFNNSSTTEMNFTVVKGLEPTILNIDCSENPAKNHTTFIVNHTYSGNNMNVSIELFDSNGQLLWTHSQNNVSTNGSYMVPWDLTSNKGFALKTGVYLYRVLISAEGGKQVSKTKKLIILKQ